MFKQKDQVIANICESYDYEKFITINGNRVLNARNLQKIKDSISKTYLIAPICVNKEWQIIDGQHRYEAAKALNFPIRYYMCKEYRLNEIQVLNANQSNWTNKDYLESYCELGFEEYLKVRNFLNQFKGIGLANALTLISKGALSSADVKSYGSPRKGTDIKKNTFREGTYKATDLSNGIQIAKDLMVLSKYLDFYKKRAFVIAFKKCHVNENFNFGLFLKKIEKFPSKAYDCPNTEHFINMIEELYNYRNKNKVNLRF